jgi:aryl-alcohol dehydrogenase-like predicted oxidoreductase
MEFRNLGKSGLKVSEVGLGGNNFGWWIEEQASNQVIESAIDAGINFIDTADAYDRGHSEEFIGKALKGKRQRVLIATKFGMPTGESPNDRGGSRSYILKAAEASLRRLQTDYIDVYYMHTPDPATPIEETLSALDSLVRDGKVRYLGCSNFAAWQVSDAQWTAQTNHFTPFVVVQQGYNMLARNIEKELVPCCQARGLGIVPYSPLANGLLTGKYRRGQEPPAETRMASSVFPNMKRLLAEANWDKIERLESFAGGRNHSTGELAIAWLLTKPWLVSVIAGARTPEQVKANIKAAEWKLSKEETAEVDVILS